MTDSTKPREEPRPDRLREINWRLVRRYGYTGMNEPFGVSAMDADLKWLVAEVERLRAIEAEIPAIRLRERLTEQRLAGGADD